MRGALLGLVLAAGCGAPGSAQWLEGFRFEWDLFNHRISYAELSLTEDAAEVVVVGGTSTTQERASLSAECDPNQTPGALRCEEFPFFDTSFVEIRTGRAEGRGLVAASGTVELVADADGESGTVTITLPRSPRGDVIALIHGLRLDTDEPLSGGESCYKPEYGWHPRRVAVILGEPSVDDLEVTVPVEVVFAAGNSVEEERRCIDAVVDQARVRMQIAVQVLAAGGAAVHTDVEHGQSYELGLRSNPDPQPAPDLADRAIAVTFDGPIGWSAIDYRFHEGDPDARGAYLRSLSFMLDADASAASGEATNYSPGTQLSGFDYAFAGTVSAIPVGLDVERRVAADEVVIEVTDAGYSTQSIPLEGGL